MHDCVYDVVEGKNKLVDLTRAAIKTLTLRHSIVRFVSNEKSLTL